ncbi:MAG TPA: protein kinase [Alloacidobacterium sp.]|nr:protein kinase [Alloacidobacterium sp.]
MSGNPKATTARHIGRYEIIGEIGRGGMGVVYRGEDKLIGREVAIKTLTEATPELRERFYVEARSGILNHPNIVTIYELGEHEGNPFIAMEFLPGEPLEKILIERGRLPLLESLSIVEQICAGLGFAHSHGLVHRDVKPANVIVLPDGRVKIVDFGIARLVDRNTRLTKTDALLGTFHYIAPERLKGEASDGRADIWSTGIMLYEMLSGELPFRGKDVSTLYRVIHEPHVPLSQLVEGAPEALSAVLNNALAKEVNDRYATAEEMAFDLRALSEDLKRDRLHELLDSARRLHTEREFAHARMILLEAQRIDPANATARMLMQQVQEQLSQLQRGEQLRQLLEQAGEALTARRFDDAITFYSQAAKLDSDNAHSVAERLEEAQAQKAQVLRVRSLWEQASEARRRGNLTAAQNLIEQALEIDENSTDLRNAYSIVLREIRNKEQSMQVENLLTAAREEYNARHYTEAIARLQEAAEIDPTHSEVQQLLFSVTARQKEERKRILLEKIVVEIQDSLDGEDFERAQDRVNRALNTLPSETALLRLKVEIEQKRREHGTRQLVRSAVLRAQGLLEEPTQALAIIDEALQQAPGDESLLEFRKRMEAHLSHARQQEQRAWQLKQAHEELTAGRYEAAIRGLEAVRLEAGGSEELEALLEHVRAEQRADEERKRRDAIRAQSQELLWAGEYQAVVALLEPLVSELDDASLTALLGEAKERLREIEERIQAVLSRVARLGESDAAGALQLLAEQPREILADQRIQELRETLTKRTAMAEAIREAVQQCEELLTVGKLSGCIDGFATVSRTYGELPEVAQAREQCEEKRRAFADAAARGAMQAACAALQRGETKQALRDLDRVRQSVPFASPIAVAEWQQLKQETRGNSGRKMQNASPGATNRRLRIWLPAMLALILCAGLALGFWRRTKTAASPSQQAEVPPAHTTEAAATYMDVNASPWATVVRIKNAAGKELDLSGQNRATPLRVDGVAAGQYEVTLEGADNEQQVIHCQISATQHLCTAKMGAADPDQLLQEVLAGGHS